MQNSMVTTALTLPGYCVVKNLGVVRGITVRSRSIVGIFFGGLHSLFGANAIIYMRHDATELMAGLTEVLCYGTPVVVQAEQAGG
jgi:uncharacterized protein YbjQ (UPF0145 family)